MAITKYHTAQSGKNAGKWVKCTAAYKCRIGGEHREVDDSVKNISDFFGGEFPLTFDDSKIAEAGFNQHGKPYVPHTIENNVFKNYLSDMEADGWTAYQGNYGLSEGGRSVRMEKYEPSLDGKFTMLFSDRDFKNLEGSVAYNRDGASTLMQNVEGYFVADTAEGYAHAEHALTLGHDKDFFTSKGNYSYKDFIDAAGRCDKCKTVVGRANLHHVAFANAMCDNCVDEAREQMETPGWYN